MELVENKLTLFSSDIWWRNLIESVYTTLEVDNNDNLRTNRDGTSAKSLYTTLCDIADQLKTDGKSPWPISNNKYQRTF